MREIKFRAWDKILNQFLPNVQNHINDKDWAFGNMLRNPERFVVEQFTGLKDKNGKEIYEGDEVEFSVFYIEDDYHDGTGYWEWRRESDFVMFENGTFCFEGIKGVPISDIEYVTGITNKDDHPMDDDYEEGLIVVGNIHES